MLGETLLRVGEDGTGEVTDDEIGLRQSVGRYSLWIDTGDLIETSGPLKMYLCVVGHCSGSEVKREYFSRGIVSTAVIFQRQIN